MKFDEVLAHCRALPVVEEALSRLRRELPARLVYHSFYHTEDVLQEALLFAFTDGLELRECELLAIAAAFHDFGFLTRSNDNEVLGAQAAADAMDRVGGYTPSERQMVMTAIADSQLRITQEGPRQVSTSRLSDYLLDADVSNLGREDFFEKAELVRTENGIADREKFMRGLVTFLSAHRWYSTAARALRDDGKKTNQQLLAEKLKGSV